ncbi:hypothetical protein E2C01_037593 [Portunus trituberculatus]|uniref:Uncharacterized protein n=1 Tax=Portunus trituberculatus TaxID=210409 RepID=A0A5B7FEG6_PORTR|nr:hypothetical protein [Portunus trituberculatus]
MWGSTFKTSTVTLHRTDPFLPLYQLAPGLCCYKSSQKGLYKVAPHDASCLIENKDLREAIRYNENTEIGM